MGTLNPDGGNRFNGPTSYSEIHYSAPKLEINHGFKKNNLEHKYLEGESLRVYFESGEFEQLSKALYGQDVAAFLQSKKDFSELPFSQQLSLYQQIKQVRGRKNEEFINKFEENIDDFCFLSNLLMIGISKREINSKIAKLDTNDFLYMLSSYVDEALELRGYEETSITKFVSETRSPPAKQASLPGFEDLDQVHLH